MWACPNPGLLLLPGLQIGTVFSLNQSDATLAIKHRGLGPVVRIGCG